MINARRTRTDSCMPLNGLPQQATISVEPPCPNRLCHPRPHPDSDHIPGQEMKPTSTTIQHPRQRVTRPGKRFAMIELDLDAV
jgi:hypothetical protein